MLSWTEVVIVSIVTGVGGIVAVIKEWMKLSFLRHVFDRHGDRKDLEIGGQAITPPVTQPASDRRAKPDEDHGTVST